jgi:ubiquinone/menaquinone biosynthesis C-methylase UbiE
MTQTPQPSLATPQQVFGMAVLNDWIASSIQVAAYYGIADLLQDDPKSIAELAAATQTHPDSLYRLLRALTSVGFFEETNTDAAVEERRFAQTPLSHYLCQDVPGSMYAMARQFGSEWEHRSWSELAYSIRTGQPAFDHVFGKSCWQYLAEDQPDEGAIFHQSMSAFSQTINEALVRAYDFSGIQTLMDVGGGQGSFLLAVLQAHPALQGILFDHSQAIEGARELIAQAGLEERCCVMAGDFFESLPSSPAVDACILKHVLHDWDDQHCLTILANCRRVLEPGKQLLIVELVLLDSHAPALGAFLDLEMLLNTYGRERTEQQYRTLLEQSGFMLRRIVPTDSSDSIIEGVAI